MMEQEHKLSAGRAGCSVKAFCTAPAVGRTNILLKCPLNAAHCTQHFKKGVNQRYDEVYFKSCYVGTCK